MQIPALPLTSRVTLGKLLHIIEPQFACLNNGDSKSFYKSLWELKTMHREGLKQRSSLFYNYQLPNELNIAFLRFSVRKLIPGEELG